MTPALIRSIRLRLRLTQEQLALRLRVAPLTVSRWERGKAAPMPTFEHQLNQLALSLPGVERAKEA